MSGSGYTVVAGGKPLEGDPVTLAEAAERARSGARSNPGVEYRVERSGRCDARYLVRNGKLARWVR